MTDSLKDVVAELDALLEVQGRLLFAKEAYDEDEANRFGVSLLDFMRRHGVLVRSSLALRAVDNSMVDALYDELFCTGKYLHASVPIDPKAIIRKHMNTAISPGRSGEVAPKLREMDDLDEQDDRDLEAWLGDRP